MMFALMVALVLLPEVSQRLDALARQVAGEHCPSGAQLEQTLELAPGRTVFVYSFATHPFPDNDCMPEYRCAWVAVRVERGTTEFSSVEDGEPRELGIGPDGSAWLYTLWTMEGGIPHLWWSVDGMKWQEVGLPRMRMVAHQYSEVIERIGTRNREILIERLGMGENEAVECWRVTPRVAFIKNGRCGSLTPLRGTTKHR